MAILHLTADWLIMIHLTADLLRRVRMRHYQFLLWAPSVCVTLEMLNGLNRKVSETTTTRAATPWHQKATFLQIPLLLWSQYHFGAHVLCARRAYRLVRRLLRPSVCLFISWHVHSLTPVHSHLTILYKPTTLATSSGSSAYLGYGIIPGLIRYVQFPCNNICIEFLYKIHFGKKWIIYSKK